MVVVQRELVQRAIRGDFDAFSILVGASTSRQYAIATLILRDGDRAQDAVRDARPGTCRRGRDGACSPRVA